MHAVHDPPSGPLYPRLHMQPVSTSLPKTDEVLDGQAVQVLSAVCPVAVEYLPREHSEHATDPFTSL